VLFESGAGGGHMPFGRHEDRARSALRVLRAGATVDHMVVPVGAVLMAPDGTRVAEWGEAPVPGVTRWKPITRRSEWSRCAACSTPFWPGSWMTVHGSRCRTCQEPLETADPRPWPPDPANPGLAAAPEWLGGPKRKKTAAKKNAAIS